MFLVIVIQEIKKGLKLPLNLERVAKRITNA
jgi:hypothetical protein